MKLTIDFIRDVFNEYNDKIFAVDYKRLPTPKFGFINTKGAFGRFHHKRFDHDGHSYILYMSTYFDRTEEQYRMTILHEMIHEYIAYDYIKDSAPHGWRFRSIMNNINSKYGTTVNVMGGKFEGVTKTKVSHLVYFVNNYDGKEWIVKTTTPKVINYINNHKSWDNVVEINTRSPFVDTNITGCRSTHCIHGHILTPELKEEIYKYYVA